MFLLNDLSSTTIKQNNVLSMPIIGQNEERIWHEKY
jgi:hypothetical protein